MTYYVYKLIDPRTDQVFYVGKGKGNRMYMHVRQAIRGEYSRKCDKIRDILAAGFEVKYEIDFRHSIEQRAYDREIELIEQIGLDNLTNVLPGGGGAPPSKLVPEPTEHEFKAVFRSLADIIRKDARGIVLMLGNVNLAEMAMTHITHMVEKYGLEFVNTRFEKYNVTVK